MNNLEKQKYQIHYYFDDKSHSMNAFVRNKAEKDILEAIRQVGYVLDSELNIETFAYEEGGLKEYFLIGFLGTVGFLAPSINDVITHYVTKDAEDKELDKKIKQETLKSLQLSNIQKENKLDEEINHKLEDKQTIRHISNFYTKINNYEKITKIGFKDIKNDEKEYIVKREHFKNFILEDKKEVIEDENAVVEIISPILKEGKYKWKGLYKSVKIDFSMGDYSFKKEVIESKHTFSNGSFIECKLQITTTYDDFGDEKRRSYSVKEVFAIQELAQEQIKLTESGKKKKRNEKQGSLFDFNEGTR
jgi:hypothetical protein